MPLEKISRVTGRGVCLPGEDVDTDRIIPARFLRCVTFDGLGRHLFEDERADARRRGPVHPLDDARFDGATILVVGRNFGCGSSREHAARAISKRGIRALVGESFADIFFGNMTALGVPCVSIARADLDALASRIELEPATLIAVDLTTSRVRVGDADVPFSLLPTARGALIDGVWDPIGELLGRDVAIRAATERLEYLRWATQR